MPNGRQDRDSDPETRRRRARRTGWPESRWRLVPAAPASRRSKLRQPAEPRRNEPLPSNRRERTRAASLQLPPGRRSPSGAVQLMYHSRTSLADEEPDHLLDQSVSPPERLYRRASARVRTFSTDSVSAPRSVAGWTALAAAGTVGAGIESAAGFINANTLSGAGWLFSRKSMPSTVIIRLLLSSPTTRFRCFR